MGHLELEKLCWQEQLLIIQIVNLLESVDLNWFKNTLEKEQEW
jgi:hypothetical protein